MQNWLSWLWLANCLAQLEPSEYFAGNHISNCTSAEFEKQDRSSTETKGNITILRYELQAASDSAHI